MSLFYLFSAYLVYLFSIFLLPMSLFLKWVFYFFRTQHIFESCRFIPSNNLCVLIEVFRLFTVNIVIDMVGFKSTILLFALYLSHFFLILLPYILFFSTIDLSAITFCFI